MCPCLLDIYIPLSLYETALTDLVVLVRPEFLYSLLYSMAILFGPYILLLSSPHYFLPVPRNVLHSTCTSSARAYSVTWPAKNSAMHAAATRL